MLIIALLATAVMQERGSLPAPQDPIACDAAGNTLELNACGALDLDREQARMEQYLQAALVRARESDTAESSYEAATQSRAYLETSQAAWMAYADIRCRGVLDQWKGGTIRTLMWQGCRIEATRQRTHDIWADYLTYSDSTPPVLPEPVRTIGEDQMAAGVD